MLASLVPHGKHTQSLLSVWQSNFTLLFRRRRWLLLSPYLCPGWNAQSPGQNLTVRWMDGTAISRTLCYSSSLLQLDHSCFDLFNDFSLMFFFLKKKKSSWWWSSWCCVRNWLEARRDDCTVHDVTRLVRRFFREYLKMCLDSHRGLSIHGGCRRASTRIGVGVIECGMTPHTIIRADELKFEIPLVQKFWPFLLSFRWHRLYGYVVLYYRQWPYKMNF